MIEMIKDLFSSLYSLILRIRSLISMEMLLWYRIILPRHSSHSCRSSICAMTAEVKVKKAAGCLFRLRDSRRADAPYATPAKQK